jgi:hypothetical protein
MCTDKPAILTAKESYSALSAKRIAYQQMIWQTPAIFLAAQAFLLNIAFDGKRDEFYQITCGFVASAIGFASWMLFLRHCYLERWTSRELERIENKESAYIVHVAPPEVPDDEHLSQVKGIRSSVVWSILLFLISFVGFIPFIRSFFKIPE